MEAFVRQLAVLSVLWAACELLLPDGRQQQMVRMTASVLVMTALLSTAGDLLGVQPRETPALAQQATQAAQTHYRQTAIRAAANQTAAYCERFLSKAGYRAQVRALYGLDGTLKRIEAVVQAENTLVTPEEAARMLADQLGMAEESICFSETGAEME